MPHRVATFFNGLGSGRRRGFTLAEVTISMVLMTMLMVGMGSAILLATHALPDEDAPTEKVIDGFETVDQLAGELYCALTFTERTATTVEFTVADRDGDLSDETIRYGWSGTSGDPLTRQYNGGDVIDIAADVRSFGLGYNISTVAETITQEVPVPGNESLLASFTGWSGLGWDTKDKRIEHNKWLAETFTLDLPDAVTALTFTRVSIKLKRDGSGERRTTVQLRAVDPLGNGEPTATLIGTSSSVRGSDLSGSFVWTELTFVDLTVEDPDTQYTFVVAGDTSNSSKIRFYRQSAAPWDSTLALRTNNSGGSWVYDPSRRNREDAPFYIYGVYTTLVGQDVITNRSFINSIAIALNMSDDAATRVDTTVPILNNVEVVP